MCIKDEKLFSSMQDGDAGLRITEIFLLTISVCYDLAENESPRFQCRVGLFQMCEAKLVISYAARI